MVQYHAPCIQKGKFTNNIGTTCPRFREAKRRPTKRSHKQKPIITRDTPIHEREFEFQRTTGAMLASRQGDARMRWGAIIVSFPACLSIVSKTISHSQPVRKVAFAIRDRCFHVEEFPPFPCRSHLDLWSIFPLGLRSMRTVSFVFISP